MTALIMTHGLQAAICAGSAEDMQVKRRTMQLHAGSAANGSFCLHSIRNVAWVALNDVHSCKVGLSSQLLMQNAVSMPEYASCVSSV